jgi:hypothetical protein
MASAGFCLTRLLTPVRAQDAGRGLQVRADTSQIAAVDRRRGCVRAREGHRGSIAEYCDGLQAYPSSVRLDDVSYTTGSGRSVRTSNYRVPAILLNLPPLLRHRLARYKTLLNDTLRRWRPIDSRVSAAIDPRCPSRARVVKARQRQTHGFLALLGDDGLLDLAALNVEYRIRGFALGVDILILPVIGNGSPPVHFRQKCFGIERGAFFRGS